MPTIVRPTRAQIEAAAEAAAGSEPWSDERIAADAARDPDVAPVLEPEELEAALARASVHQGEGGLAGNAERKMLQVGDFVFINLPFTTGASKGRIVAGPGPLYRVLLTDGTTHDVHEKNLQKLEKRA